jgi:hypothetical protein
VRLPVEGGVKHPLVPLEELGEHDAVLAWRDLGTESQGVGFH